MATMQERREIAAGAARSQLRHLGFAPEDASEYSAMQVLESLARMQPDLVASVWYTQASDTQINLFCQEWRTWAYNQRIVNKINYSFRHQA